MTTLWFAVHSSNLKGPVPLGWRLKSLSYCFTAAGETISPAGVAKFDKNGANGSFKVKTTVLSFGVVILSIAEKKTIMGMAQYGNTGAGYPTFVQT